MLDLLEALRGHDFEEYADKYAPRIDAIKGIRIHNDRTIKLIKLIRLFMLTATGGGGSACATLTAPTRGGKTTVIEAFRSVYEADPTSTSDKMPVVYVQVPGGGATTKSVGRAALEALRDVNPERGDGDFKRVQIGKALRRRQTKLLVFDEIQRLVERDGGKVAFKVADWIQTLVNDSEGVCGILLVGTTRGRRLFQNNGHLVGRNDHHFEIAPYKRKTVDEADWDKYRGYLAHFDEQVSLRGGFQLGGFHKSDLAQRIHAASRGYPGATAKLIQAAAYDAMVEGERTVIDRDSLATAFDRIWLHSAVKTANPFTTSKPLLPEAVWSDEWEDVLD